MRASTTRPYACENSAILGRYEVVDLIGHGGMGALYRARDPASAVTSPSNSQSRLRYAGASRSFLPQTAANI